MLTLPVTKEVMLANAAKIALHQIQAALTEKRSVMLFGPDYSKLFPNYGKGGGC